MRPNKNKLINHENKSSSITVIGSSNVQNIVASENLLVKSRKTDKQKVTG